jgi:hypothetical protein
MDAAAPQRDGRGDAQIMDEKIHMDTLLKWFGPDEYSARLERIRAFWGGNERFVVTVNTSEHLYRKEPNQATMLELASLNLKAQATLPGVNLPSFYANFGPISTAKYWGGTARIDSTGGHIFVDPVADSAREALAITPLPIDHPEMDAALAIQLYKEMCERLPTESLWLRIPDLQGPLNTAGLVVNQENLLVEMYTAPEVVQEFLERITELLIRYAHYFNDHTQGRVCGTIWPHTFLPFDLGIALTQDLMPLLSAEVYEEFSIPCLNRLTQEFGGLHIHCCGDWGRHAPALERSHANIVAAEFHYPFTRMEELECLAPDTVFIPIIEIDRQNDYATVTDYYEYLLASTEKTHRFWFTFPHDTEEALVFAKRHDF